MSEQLRNGNENDYRRERLTNVCAQRAHEANRAHCISVGDMSQPKWEFAPQWQRDSARQGVRHALENPASGPEESHGSWLRQKVDDGWVFGEVKDPEAKEHPCLVPYGRLPESQRVKNSIFLAVVRSTAEEVASGW